MKDHIEGELTLFIKNRHRNDKAHPFCIQGNYVKISFLSPSCTIITDQSARKKKSDKRIPANCQFKLGP